jgi:alpha-ketoglutarate-dependent 2,4-dichlorophenoxyacetate dioxygenase
LQSKIRGNHSTDKIDEEVMTDWTVEPLHSEFGARVTGVNFSSQPDAKTALRIHELIDEYSFVVFPGQACDDERHLAFTQALGNAEPSHIAKGEGKLEYFGTIGNVQADGSVLGNDHQKTKFLTGNNMWHTDASFKPVPAMLSIMCAYETPSEGGETLFVSNRAAYNRLEAEEQARLDPMVGIHDYVFSRSKVAPDAVSPELAATLPPVRQRLVRRNPGNGRKGLFIGSHVRAVEGLSEPEGRALLDDLVEHATVREAIYSHAWQPGQLAIWDNRCLLHRGAGYDADKHRRYMRQTRVSGVCSSLEE